MPAPILETSRHEKSAWFLGEGGEIGFRLSLESFAIARIRRLALYKNRRAGKKRAQRSRGGH